HCSALHALHALPAMQAMPAMQARRCNEATRERLFPHPGRTGGVNNSNTPALAQLFKPVDSQKGQKSNGEVGKEDARRLPRGGCRASATLAGSCLTGEARPQGGLQPLGLRSVYAIRTSRRTAWKG